MRLPFASSGLGLLVYSAALWSLGMTAPAAACPFCTAVSQTFSEEMASMDAVVVARRVSDAKVAADAAGAAEVPRASFDVIRVLKGSQSLGNVKRIQTVFFGTAQVGDQFLIMGVDPPRIAWSTPVKVSERAVAYLATLPDLPAEGADRLAFFQKHLEDADALLARDAYDEFARAPYKAVQDLKDRMDHAQIVSWIRDPKIPASRRRLYLVMLSVCGQAQDAAMLEGMLKSSDRTLKAGLDALIASYLTLRGPAGTPLVEDLFLKNAQAEYADTYAAITALRFHGSETNVIPRERILAGLRHLLDRPQLADLVIPDLARWEDWSQIERLVKLFKEADEKSSWVRVPVINYLRACPKPEAKSLIQELEKIDPDAVQRANTFFPFGVGAGSSGGGGS